MGACQFVHQPAAFVKRWICPFAIEMPLQVMHAHPLLPSARSQAKPRCVSRSAGIAELLCPHRPEGGSHSILPVCR